MAAGNQYIPQNDLYYTSHVHIHYFTLCVYFSNVSSCCGLHVKDCDEPALPFTSLQNFRFCFVHLLSTPLRSPSPEQNKHVRTAGSGGTSGAHPTITQSVSQSQIVGFVYLQVVLLARSTSAHHRGNLSNAKVGHVIVAVHLTLLCFILFQFTLLVAYMP